MKKEFKPILHKGRIYLKDNKWVVLYAEEGKSNYMEVHPKDISSLIDPYSQAQETCFEKQYHPETFEVVARLWPVSEMAQELKHYFETTPQEEIDAAWEATEKQFGNVGPTMDEFLGTNSNKRKFNMKELTQALSVASMFIATYEMFQGRVDGAILFSVWSFYLQYVSDRRE